MLRLDTKIKNMRRVRELNEAHPKLLGPCFGLLVYTANIPVKSVAAEIGVTTTILYRWINGEVAVSNDNKNKIIQVGKKLTESIRKGDLPVYGGVKDRDQIFLNLLQH